MDPKLYQDGISVEECDKLNEDDLREVLLYKNSKRTPDEKGRLVQYFLWQDAQAAVNELWSRGWFSDGENPVKLPLKNHLVILAYFVR